jgi:hypothetical protein
VRSSLRTLQTPSKPDPVARLVADERHVSDKDLQRLRLILRMQSMMEVCTGEEDGPAGMESREVVSCTIINEGSPLTGAAAPRPAEQAAQPSASRFGCRECVSCRWLG